MPDDDLSREELIARAEDALSQLTEAEAAAVIVRSRKADLDAKQRNATKKLTQYVLGN